MIVERTRMLALIMKFDPLYLFGHGHDGVDRQDITIPLFMVYSTFALARYATTVMIVLLAEKQ